MLLALRIRNGPLTATLYTCAVSRASRVPTVSARVFSTSGSHSVEHMLGRIGSRHSAQVRCIAAAPAGFSTGANNVTGELTTSFAA